MPKIILFLIALSASVAKLYGQGTPDLTTTMCVGDTAVMTVAVADTDSLQWYRNGSVIFGASNDTLVATLGGTYYLRAFRAQCYDVSGDIQILITSPRANDDYLLASPGSLKTFDVLANDEANCASFDKSSFTIIKPPIIGTLLSSAGGTIVYKSSPATLGTDQFVYRIKDVEGRLSNEARVNIELYIDCAIVSPNPVQDMLHVSVNSRKIHALKIFDSWGRELYHTTVSRTQLDIDMKPYVQGFYLLKLFEHNGEGCSIRVFKK
jgi:hypothetical protein